MGILAAFDIDTSIMSSDLSGLEDEVPRSRIARYFLDEFLRVHLLSSIS